MLVELKTQIKDALGQLQEDGLSHNATALFAALGYRSDKTAPLETRSLDELLEKYDLEQRFNRKGTRLDWKSVDILFQLTDAEVKDALLGQNSLFESGSDAYNGKIIQSYLFLVLELNGEDWSRSDLAKIVREINKLFPMPALVLFKHGVLASLGVINRRLNKINVERDVLEKVTLIKDIRLSNPHRAHLEILEELNLTRLKQEKGVANFVELDAEWREILDLAKINRRFFRELSDWYFWARREIRLPGVAPDNDAKQSEATIRLLTRTMFCWFVREKGLVPDDFFEPSALDSLLVNFDSEKLDGDSYYRAVLQNLFFATLNTPRDDPKRPRRFRSKNNSGGQDGHFGIHNVLRYESEFRDSATALQKFDSVPFLNGGLFECLDETDKKPRVRHDGFSDRSEEWAKVSDKLFFARNLTSDEINARLNHDYGTDPKTKPKTYEVQGLFDIFRRYKFTVDENTPVEQEIALDPELLGQAFENLLASYNEDTKTTARKKTGSFYTPREVVDYMVGESLVIRLEAMLRPHNFPDLETHLRDLFSYKESKNPFSPPETDILIGAIDALKVLDPACGSGAYPMSVLHHLVRALEKLDPGNARWKARQIERAQSIEDDLSRADALAAIERNFSSSRSFNDYGRKLYLIQNAIYGVDLQPIAVQISKLRFCISLVIDQKSNRDDINYGIEPLPHLETNIVAANSLLTLLNRGQLSFRTPEIDALEKELKQVRRSYFLVRTPAKVKELRDKDKQLRGQIKNELEANNWPKEVADELAEWEFWNPHQSAGYFDSEWMFNLSESFDCVITNPPYVKSGRFPEFSAKLKDRYTKSHSGNADLYVYFYEMALESLKPGGTLCFISSNKYFLSGYGEKLRGFLTTEGRIRSILDFGDAPVFEAIAYPSIIVVSRVDPQQNDDKPVRAMSWEVGPPIETFPEVFETNYISMMRSDFTKDGWRLENPATLQLLTTLRKRGQALGDYINGKFYRGILTGLNEAFVINAETRTKLIADDESRARKGLPKCGEIIKPFLRGRDVKRWTVNFAEQYLIFTRRGTDIEKYPAIKAHLETWRMQLEPGIKGGRKAGSYKWFEVQDNIAYWENFETPKIILGRFMNSAVFAYDEDNFFHNDALYMIPNANKFVVAILNSAAAWWFLRQICTDLQNGYLQAFKENLFQIPIPNANESQRKLIELLVEYCIALKDVKMPSATVQLGFWEQTIDALVFELFLPEEFAASNRAAFETVSAADLPHLSDLGDDVAAQIQALQPHFERVYNPKHPLRELVFFLDSLPSVRVMLGKN